MKINTKALKFIKLIPFIAVFVYAFLHRVPYMNDTSKDIYAYVRAISDLLAGKNPYTWTIESYSNPDDPSNHGFAYLPGLLYLFTPLYVLSLMSGFSHVFLWKIPVLAADLAIGVILWRILYKKSYILSLVSVAVWLVNPYSYFRTGYTYTDPLPILFMLIALLYLEKDEVLSGASYAISIALKTFPIILLPVFLLKAKNKKNFVLSTILVGIFFSLPFLTSIDNFSTYLRGSLFVHNERFIQGRPFLFYLSYYYDIEFFQILPFEFYSLMSVFFVWVLIPLAYFLLRVKNKYILSTLAFLNFYIFTPVLNRTYLIWFLPIFLISCFDISERYKKHILYYLFVSAYYVFYSWYLIQWQDGFHVWRP